MPERDLTILMADDDLEDLELVEDAFISQDPKARLEKVTNGRAAIEYLNSRPDTELPCLIILDYNMPELTGSQVLAQIASQSRYKNIPRVVLSTSNTSSYIQECMKNGATAYFVKPDNMKEMQLLAKKMLSFCGNGAS